MTVKNVEKLEKSRVAVTVEVGAEEFEAAVAKAYAKARGKLSIPGFRPGKAPRKMIEKLYGAGVFYSDAVDIALPEAYTQAIGQSGLDVVGYPEVEIVDDKIAWIFIPLGWGNWQATVASITGLVAKENIVGTLGILYGGGDLNVYQNIAVAFTGITGYSFLVFNLLCAPCFAAIGAIKREMNNAKWTWFAIGYQCGFAYLIALMINQFGNAFTGSLNVIGLIAAIVVLAGMIYMLFKPYKEATKLSDKH